MISEKGKYIALYNFYHLLELLQVLSPMYIQGSQLGSGALLELGFGNFSFFFFSFLPV